MGNSTVAPEGKETPARLSGSLGVVSIVFMVVAAASPLVVVGSVSPLGIMIGNGVGFPALFAIGAVILVLFAVGLTTMTRHVPKPGAFFTFVGYGLGPAAGIVAAWLAILAYTSVQIAVHAYMGYVLSGALSSLGGPALPWWLCSLLVIALVGYLGYRNIDLSSKVLGFMLVLEVGIVLALVVAVLITGGDSGLDLSPFDPANIVSGSPGIGLMFAMGSFIGFEATVVFRDEARDPTRTIPRSTYAAVIGIGVFYTLAAWSIVMAWGSDKVVAKATEDPGTMIFATMHRYLGVLGEKGVNFLLITAMLACVLAFHNVLARYQHSMANAGVLPRALSGIHPRHRSPHTSSLVQTVTAGALIAVFAVLGLDPVFAVFTPLGGVTNLAIALLITLTSVAILVYFAKTKVDRRPWNTVIAPVLGLIGMVAAAVLIVAYFPLLVGDVDAEGNQVVGGVTILLLGLIAAFPVLALIQAAVIKKRNPASYEEMIERVGA
ncbi:APC family permease [Sinosporangium siamense]|uniref:Amino acid transporter n=1 Tax=Sinosporangium siamense TaxID=1367973 RepID=A0A919RMM5_9ACTN|nr:APC family permease [Sinosporangium siamense]GII96538.1 amino acid transporter [Sinosporangium siamense]